MKIILLENVINLGHLGDIVIVKNGYARTYLIPKGAAMSATNDNIKAYKLKEAEYKAKQNTILQLAQQRFDKINDTIITITAKSGGDGRLFGSITALTIANAINEIDAAANIDIKKTEVFLPYGALKTLGETDIKILLHNNLTAIVHLNVISSENTNKS